MWELDSAFKGVQLLLFSLKMHNAGTDVGIGMCSWGYAIKVGLLAFFSEVEDV